MKTLAIMQPYFFPYIGYWQLINAVDRFVIYDDVNYIKGGWINRNRILINGTPTYITAPIRKASPFKHICDHNLLPAAYWRHKLVKTIALTYQNAPYFDEVFPVIERLIQHEANNLADYLAYQLQELARLMRIDTEFVVSSRCYKNDHLRGQARILDICQNEQASVYINLRGGENLYDVSDFKRGGIELNFIVMRQIEYPQRNEKFAPCLSIIDALMNVGASAINHHLNAYDLTHKIESCHHAETLCE